MIARLKCIYYLSWDETAFFDTSQKVFLGLQMGTMGQTLLHLVDRRGETLPVAIRLAVEAAHRWVSREYPHLDAAVVAGWAEDVGKEIGRAHV